MQVLALHMVFPAFIGHRPPGCGELRDPGSREPCRWTADGCRRGGRTVVHLTDEETEA